jgi:hypothetical protein
MVVINQILEEMKSIFTNDELTVPDVERKTAAIKLPRSRPRPADLRPARAELEMIGC